MIFTIKLIIYYIFIFYFNYIYMCIKNNIYIYITRMFVRLFFVGKKIWAKAQKLAAPYIGPWPTLGQQFAWPWVLDQRQVKIFWKPQRLVELKKINFQFFQNIFLEKVYPFSFESLTNGRSKKVYVLVLYNLNEKFKISELSMIFFKKKNSKYFLKIQPNNTIGIKIN